ncbi:MAG TPA: hypothetical protein VFY23_04475 [Candidatus Limnocylindrales bacterium]|nr:hypothetical protein [Candidatus Limnocylindrales bacterium]
MRALLLRCYPARWRVRYGDEFEALLGERPLGPFDVADVLLGALDAHLHLRGLGAASEHRKGFAMSLRVGGYAAVIGGVLWLLVLAGNAINDGRESGVPFLSYAVVGATIATLVALIGLSAFQARRHPALTWAAFAIPALGATVGLFAIAAMVVTGDSDSALLGVSSWFVASMGLLAMVLGSTLFALATFRTHALSRPGSVMLGLGAVLVFIALAGISGGLLPSPLEPLVILAAVVVFPAGWVLLGVSALRVTGPAPLTIEGASL